MLQTQSLENLPLANKINLLEQITNSILKDEEEYRSPAWHAEILASRKDELEKPQEWLSLEEVAQELTK